MTPSALRDLRAFAPVLCYRGVLRRLLGGANVNQVLDDLEVLGVVGEQGGAVDGRRRHDGEVGHALAGPTASPGDRRQQAAPLARDAVIERQRVGEAGLEQAEARSAKRPLLLIDCDEQPEVQLRNRDRADRRFGLCRNIARDQDRGIKQEPQLLCGPGVAQLCAEVLDVPGECRVGRQGPQIGKLRASHPLTSPHRPQRRHRAPRDRDRDLLAGLSPAQNLADVVAQLFLGDYCHSRHGSSIATSFDRHVDGVGPLAIDFAEPVGPADRGAPLRPHQRRRVQILLRSERSRSSCGEGASQSSSSRLSEGEAFVVTDAMDRVGAPEGPATPSAVCASGLTANAPHNVPRSAGSGAARLADLPASVEVTARTTTMAVPGTTTPAPVPRRQWGRRHRTSGAPA